MNHISIGPHSRIISGYGNFVGGESKTALYTAENGNIIIGKNVGMSNCTIISFSSIKIGDDVFIGGGTKIYDSDFHPLRREDRENRPTEIPTAPINIEEGAFIGGHSIILKGVTIGKNSVIGAGSTVTRDIPANEVWAGVPARKIREL